MNSQLLDTIAEIKQAVDGKRVSTDTYAELSNIFSEAVQQIEDIELKTGKDYLLLKWGTWKSWNSENTKIKKLMQEYNDLGVTVSAMEQKNTPRRKDILCEVIDLIDGVIQNDWDGNYYTKEEARKYVMEYGS